MVNLCRHESNLPGHNCPDKSSTYIVPCAYLPNACEAGRRGHAQPSLEMAPWCISRYVRLGLPGQCLQDWLDIIAPMTTRPKGVGSGVTGRASKGRNGFHVGLKSNKYGLRATRRARIAARRPNSVHSTPHPAAAVQRFWPHGDAAACAECCEVCARTQFD